jgi:hypothetical protein
MTVYEILDLMAGERQFGMMLYMAFLTLSSAVFVGAYIAGRRLTPILVIGVLAIYAVASGALIMTRVEIAARYFQLADDLENLAQNEGIDLAAVQHLINAPQNWIAYAAYGLIWTAVVFFVVYARTRFNAGE